MGGHDRELRRRCEARRALLSCCQAGRREGGVLRVGRAASASKRASVTVDPTVGAQWALSGRSVGTTVGTTVGTMKTRGFMRFVRFKG